MIHAKKILNVKLEKIKIYLNEELITRLHEHRKVNKLQKDLKPMLFSIQKRLKWKRLQQRIHINKCQNESDELQETNKKVQDDIDSILCFEQIVKKNF